MAMFSKKEDYSESSRKIEQGKVLAAMAENEDIQTKMALIVMEKIKEEVANYIDNMIDFKIQSFQARLDAVENELLKDTASGKRPVAYSPEPVRALPRTSPAPMPRPMPKPPEPEEYEEPEEEEGLKPEMGTDAIDMERLAQLTREKDRIDRELLKMKQIEGKMRRGKLG